MLTLLMLSAVAPIAAGRPPAPACRPQITMARDDAIVRVRPLNEMPPATQALAVLRERNGCNELAVVRCGVGAPGR